MGVDIETIKAGDGANFPPKGCKVQGITILTVLMVFAYFAF